MLIALLVSVVVNIVLFVNCLRMRALMNVVAEILWDYAVLRVRIWKVNTAGLMRPQSGGEATYIDSEIEEQTGDLNQGLRSILQRIDVIRRNSRAVYDQHLVEALDRLKQH